MKKTFRKLTAVFLAAVMAVTCLPQEAIAEILPQEAEVPTWGDTGTYQDDSLKKNNVEAENSVFAGGDGTYENPYQIKDAEGIKAINNNLSACYIQVADIDLNYEPWIKVGEWNVPFTGTYNGNGYTLKNLCFKDGDYTKINSDISVALFGCNEGTIKNVKVERLSVWVYSPTLIDSWRLVHIGGIAGINLGKIENCEISSGYIQTNINVSSLSSYGVGGWIYAGGICGRNEGEIYGCINSADIYINSSERAYVGGICGLYTGKISCSLNEGIISAYCKSGPYGSYRRTPDIQCYAAGIAGKSLDSNAYVTNCFSTAQSVTATIATGCVAREDLMNASFISYYDSENCYALKNTVVQESYKELYNWTSENGVTLTDPDILYQEWNKILEEIRPLPKELYFENKFTLLSPGESKILTVHQCTVSDKDGELVYSNDKIIDNSSLKWTLTSGEGVISLSEDGTVTALSEGLASLDVYSKDDMSLFTSCFVYVGDPNTFEFSGTYDTRQYYSNSGFYSQTSSLSDCVEIYLLFNNKFADELARIDYDPEKDSTNKELKSVAPITLTASVSGNGLSFERDSNKNTYTASFEEIPAGKAAHDLLMLFPTENLASNSLRTEYTVTVTLKSDSFDTVTEKYSFTIEPLETKNAKEHIAFTVNPDYLLSKKNLYGNTMVDLKDDEEYGWTKVTTFNFDNYYQIVLSDILIEMLNVNQKQAPSLVPSVVKEWYGTYKPLLGDITTLVNDSYLDNIDLSETAVDKLLKESKYVTNGIHTDDDAYQAVLDLLGTVDNVDKITKIFEKIDKTNQVFKMVKLGTNVIGDIMDWGNKLAVFNAFAESEQSLKTVMKHLADTIPASDYKMKEAVYDYINYSNDLGGQLEEVVESFYEMSGKVSIEAFNSFVGMSMIKYISIHLFNWVCNHVTLEGGISVAASAAFPIVQTYFSAALVGVDLGLCLSDVLCNTSDISVEMSKTVAMSEFSPYIISTLNYYETALYNAPNDDSVIVFEDAFFLHRAAQSYIMEHTVKSLETKRDSVLIGLIGNLIGQGRGDYNEVISAVLAHKSVIDNLKCHSYTGETTAVTQTKVITVRCPVNVFVYGQDGTETVIITDDEVEYAAEGINVFVQNGEKYIALPADQTYSIKIVAFGDGVMEYRVDEYGDGGQCLKTVEKSEIPLVDGRMFTGQIVDQMNAEPESYALVYDGVPVVPDELSALPGDVDGSGEVDELDSVALARYLASWDVAIDQSAADVDGNGEVDELDSVMLARKLAGWNV